MVEYLEKLGNYPPSSELTEEEKKEVISLKKELQKFKEMDDLTNLNSSSESNSVSNSNSNSEFED